MHTTRLSLLGLSVRVASVCYYYYGMIIIFQEHVTASVSLSLEEHAFRYERRALRLRL